MQVTVENLNSVKKKLHIEISNDVVVQELDQAYKNLKKTAKIKGYRPGKAPRSVLERLFKKDVHSDVSSRLLQDSLINAIREKDLKVIGTPKIDSPGLDAKEPYKYDVIVEVEPEIDELGFKGLKLKKNLYRVSDEEMSAQLKMLQKNLAQQKTVEEVRPVQKGDFALIDYEGFKDGKPFAETEKTENFTLKVGNGQIFEEFDEQLIGMNPGESKEINIHFPEDYFNKKLANLDITFYVKLNGIREEVLPEIDDDFAKDLGKYETLDQLKNAISDNLRQGYEKRTEQELNEQIFTALIAKKDFEVPDIMVEYELNGIIADIERS
ncbi:MAG: trigger factor, partial [Desulfobacterales bacterium]|nr:trigger factor [Desulfobacterales bacterium]